MVDHDKCSSENNRKTIFVPYQNPQHNPQMEMAFDFPQRLLNENQSKNQQGYSENQPREDCSLDKIDRQ